MNATVDRFYTVIDGTQLPNNTVRIRGGERRKSNGRVSRFMQMLEDKQLPNSKVRP